MIFVTGVWLQFEHIHHDFCAVLCSIKKCNKTLGDEIYFVILQTNIEAVKGKLCPIFQMYSILFQFYAG